MSVGVYRLEHMPTGRFYIGSSMELERRQRAWFQKLRMLEASDPLGRFYGCGMSDRFWRAARGTAVSEWTWVVLERFQPAASELVLRTAEGLAIRSALELAPDRCLNTERFAFVRQ